MRTAAASAICAKYLAKGDAEKLCIIGAGVQGRYQLLALQEVLPLLQEVRVCDIDVQTLARFVETARPKSGVTLKPETDVVKAVEGSDIVVIVITDEHVFFKAEWIEEGMLICSLGDTVMEYEALRKMDKIVVDHLKQTMHMGELKPWVQKGLISEQDVYAELGEIVAGKKPGRENAAERILAAPIGVASLDIATALRVYNLAKQKNLGQVIKWL
jgi:ornithine cyclodeaminase/alanine dehydrogenase-like protein (mu-crystallin family)